MLAPSRSVGASAQRHAFLTVADFHGGSTTRIKIATFTMSITTVPRSLNGPDTAKPSAEIACCHIKSVVNQRIALTTSSAPKIAVSTGARLPEINCSSHIPANSARPNRTWRMVTKAMDVSTEGLPTAITTFTTAKDATNSAHAHVVAQRAWDSLREMKNAPKIAGNSTRPAMTSRLAWATNSI